MQWETIMRYLPASCGAALILLCVSSAAYSERAFVPPPNPIAREMVAEAERLSRGGDLNGAQDMLETALVLDPRSRDALFALARIAEAQGLPGKAAGYYADVLTIDPKSKRALSAQGIVYARRGATQAAEANLAQLDALCRRECAEMVQLKKALSEGPVALALPVGAVMPKPQGESGAEGEAGQATDPVPPAANQPDAPPEPTPVPPPGPSPQ